LEAEHGHKAQVEAGMRELKSNFGLSVLRKHRFMANWAWLPLVCLGHNLCCWLQTLGRLGAERNGGNLKAKRLRYRYLAVPALVVRSARRLSVKLPGTYPYFARFMGARSTLASSRPPAEVHKSVSGLAGPWSNAPTSRPCQVKRPLSAGKGLPEEAHAR
jgi:Transposase DDE domain group 1